MHGLTSAAFMANAAPGWDRIGTRFPDDAGKLRRAQVESIAVIDFETTGLSPDYGDRATEVAAVLVRDG